MKKYKNFILSENIRSDTTIINDPDLLVNIILEKCSKFNIDTDIPIYRGLHTSEYGMIINPKKT